MRNMKFDSTRCCASLSKQQTRECAWRIGQKRFWIPGFSMLASSIKFKNLDYSSDVRVVPAVIRINVRPRWVIQFDFLRAMRAKDEPDENGV